MDYKDFKDLKPNNKKILSDEAKTPDKAKKLTAKIMVVLTESERKTLEKLGRKLKLKLSPLIRTKLAEHEYI